MHPYIYGFTGVFATMIHDSILTPIDVLKQRAQMAPSYIKSFPKLIKHIIHTEGFLSLYRSFPITLFMNLPTSFILVSANENFKVLFKPKDGHTYLSWFLCGGAAGALASAFTIPFDVIKTKLQTQNCFGVNDNCSNKICAECPAGVKNETSTQKVDYMNKTTESTLKKDKKVLTLSSLNARFYVSNNTNKAEVQAKASAKPAIIYTDILSTIKLIIKEEGFKGFTKGMLPRMLNQAPSAAISWSTYEIAKSHLTKFSTKH